MSRVKWIVGALIISAVSVTAASYLASRQPSRELVPGSVGGLLLLVVGQLVSPSAARSEEPATRSTDRFVLAGLLLACSAPAAMAAIWAWRPDQLKWLVRVGTFFLSAGGASLGYVVLHAELPGLADKFEYVGGTLGLPQLLVQVFTPD